MILRPSALVGVRPVRGGLVIFADSAGHTLAPGQLVVIEDSALRPQPSSVLAMVVIGSGQIIENEAGVGPSAHVLRMATDEDVALFGRRAAAELDAMARATDLCSELGLHARVVEARVAPDGASLRLTLDGETPDPEGLAREMARRSGLPVELFRRGADGSASAVSGVGGAGLPHSWSHWLVPPGGEPLIRALPGGEEGRLAREFIDRLFPFAERAPRRGQGLRRPHPRPAPDEGGGSA